MRPVEKPWQLVRQKLDVCVTGRTSPGGAPGTVDVKEGPRGKERNAAGSRRGECVLRGHNEEVLAVDLDVPRELPAEARRDERRGRG